MENKIKFWYEDYFDNKDMISIHYEDESKGSIGKFSCIDYRKDLNRIMNSINNKFEFDEFMGETENKKEFIKQFLDYFNNDIKLNDRLNELKPISSRFINLNFTKLLLCNNGNFVIDRDEYPELNNICDNEILNYLSNCNFFIKNKNGDFVDLFDEFNKPYKVIHTDYQVNLNGQKNIGKLPIEEYFKDLFDFGIMNNLFNDGLIKFYLKDNEYRISFGRKKEFINKGKGEEIFNECMSYVKKHKMESINNVNYKKKIMDMELIDNYTMDEDNVTYIFRRREMNNRIYS